MRTLASIVGIIAGVWILLVVVAWVFQERMILLPMGGAPDPGGLAVEEVRLATDDGVDLGAWFVPAEGTAVGTVLVANGNAGHRGFRTPLARALSERGHNVLLMDYRGFGDSEGRPRVAELVTDVRAARDHLVGRPEVDAGTIVYFGESIGSGPAAALATTHPPAGLILRSPPPSLAAVGRHHYRFLPVGTLLRTDLEVTEDVAALDVPVLVVTGEVDGIVPPDLSAEVAAAGDHVRHVEVSGADHNDRALLDGTELVDAVDAFVREVVDR